ncbi:Heat stress transcription factor A-1 [Platanthera zijinensis]|uniref:Heat stress transcription factor A-1 n=1 Tax=Platanthera zijinensis TaxID=2320716 RepID=A0AAP0AV20_9ASPA
MDVGGVVVGGAIPGANPPVNGSGPTPFLGKTYDMVDDPSTGSIVSWGPGGNTFIVWNLPDFARDLLPKYFKHSNFSSFVRQLNTYGFKKIDPDRWEFANDGFLRGQKHLLKSINRRKSSHSNTQPQTVQKNASLTSCVEVGNFGLDEEITRLKRDKNALKQELVRLRQHQQTTDQQLETLNERIHGMEQRQQQMMSFLAKAMKIPGFLAKLVQQNKANNSHRVVGGNKKRRLPDQEELAGESASPDGQIVEYHLPILTSESSPVLDFSYDPLESITQPANLFSALDALDTSASSSSRSSVVTFQDIASQGTRILPVSSPAVSEVESAPVPRPSLPVEIPRADVDFQGIFTDANMSYAASEAERSLVHCIAGVDGMNLLDLDKFSCDADVDVFGEGVDDTKLTVFAESFWKQLLSTSLLPVDAEEVDSSLFEADHDAGKTQADGLDADGLAEQLPLHPSSAEVL